MKHFWNQKKILASTVLIFLAAISAFAQNVGIGNTNPNYRLDLSGRLRLRGGTDLNNSSGLWLGGAGADSINNKAFIGMSSDSTMGLYGGEGSGWNFYMDVRTGNTGIGNAVKLNRAGLTVNKSEGAVNAMFGSNTTGVSIESNFPGIGFNNYYNVSRKTISTGYSGYIGANPISGGMQMLVSDNSYATNATPTLKAAIDIKPDGKVGIGVADPFYQLDVAGRMRIRSTPGYTAGLWLNNDANSASTAFIGMQADNQVGFYGGNGAGWSLLMNTQNGALSLNGSTGEAGQVLMSSGNSAAPSWVSPGTVLKTGYSGASTNVVLPPSGSVELTNSQYTIILNRPARVILHYKTGTRKGCAVGNCNTKWSFTVNLDNLQNFVSNYVVDGQSYAAGASGGYNSNAMLGPDYFDLDAGTHTFRFKASNEFNQPEINFQVISMIIEQ